MKDYVPFLRVFGLDGKKSRSSEIKKIGTYIVFFKGSKKINELKKKVEGGPQNTQKYKNSLFFLCILLTLVKKFLKSKLLRPVFLLFYYICNC